MRSLIQFGLLSVLLSTAAIKAVPIADSVADFSSVQGGNNWYYGYYDGSSAIPWTPTDFKQFTTYYVPPNGTTIPLWSLNRGEGGVWTADAAEYMHPNGQITFGNRLPVDQWAVRRWVSPLAGTVTLSGTVADADAQGADSVRNGVIARIFNGQSVVWYGDIAEGNSTGLTYSFTQDVAVGTVIDFTIDPRDHRDWSDTTRFTVTITPEPVSFAFIALPISICLRRKVA